MSFQHVINKQRLVMAYFSFHFVLSLHNPVCVSYVPHTCVHRISSAVSRAAVVPTVGQCRACKRGKAGAVTVFLFSFVHSTSFNFKNCLSLRKVKTDPVPKDFHSHLNMYMLM